MPQLEYSNIYGSSYSLTSIWVTNIRTAACYEVSAIKFVSESFVNAQDDHLQQTSESTLNTRCISVIVLLPLPGSAQCNVKVSWKLCRWVLPQWWFAVKTTKSLNALFRLVYFFFLVDG